MNASKDVLGYIDALHLKAAKSQNIVRESFRGSFSPYFEQLQTIFAQENAAVSKSVDVGGGEALLKPCRSIF